MGEFAVGQAVSRLEDPRLLKGGGRFVDDIVLPGMAFGHVLRSPHAHARIKSIDTAAAQSAPGVLIVLTGADWRASGFGDLPTGGGRTRRDGSPMYVPRYQALVEDRVRRVGDYVAFVVAETRHQAMDAAELISVDYESLSAITSTEEAPEPGAPLVWEDCPDNICYVHRDGDEAETEAAFVAAAHVVRQKMVINRVSANSLEPRGCIAQFDAGEGRYTLHTTLQGLQPYRALLAGILHEPEAKVRVITGDIGGGFGMKSAVYNEGPLALLASKLTGRPVKWISGRSEAFSSDGHARDHVVDAALALDGEGRFLGLRVRIVAALGAYLQLGAESSAVKNLGTLAGVYTIPAIHVDVTGVFTNTNPIRAYRGNGRPESAYVIERLIEMAADEMAIDPAELRRRNTIPPEAMPYKTALTFIYDSGEFEKNMDMALAMADYAGFEQRREDAAGRGKLRGIGISNSIERAGAEGVEGAEIRFDRSGSATVLTGSIAQGQGHATMYTQLACDRLGLDPADIHYISGDTDKVPLGQGTFGSRSATIGGSAFHLAAEKIVPKATQIAAHLLEVAPDTVDFEDGVFTAAGTNQSLTIKELARKSLNPANLPDGMEPGLSESAMFAARVANYPNGTHVCEVEIDAETGVVSIVGYNVVDDVGTVINPLLLKGQIHGGVAQGVGQVLMEDIRYDDVSGQLVTGSFMDYCMPRACDLSPMDVKSNPVPTKTNPLGVKGAGEAGNVGALPAVANAVVDALSVYGIRHIPMPATAERIWRAIREAEIQLNS